VLDLLSSEAANYWNGNAALHTAENAMVDALHAVAAQMGSHN
jgi:hypothetical protein